MHDPTRVPIVWLGFSDDARALVDHLGLEAPDLLPRIVVVDPSPAVVDRLRAAGVPAACADPRDPAALAAVGRGKTVMVVPSGRALAPQAAPGARSILGNWRLWALLGVAIVDGLVLVVPLTPTVLLLAALVAPAWVRRAAGFLDGLGGAGPVASRGPLPEAR